MGTLDSDMGALISAGLRELGVNLFLGESVQAFDASGGCLRGVVTDRRTLSADLAVLGMGVMPLTELADSASIPLGVKGAIRVDARMRTGVEGVWAAGDCAESLHLVSGRPVHIALGSVANKQGRVAGINISGGDATFPGVVGTAVTKVCELEVARTGLNERESERFGIKHAAASIKSHTRAGYYPGAGEITVKLLGEKGSGRLLGGQIIGREGAAKRIDIIATALHAGFTVGDMIHLDLGYAPPSSLVWDPVQTAARKLVKLL